MAEQAIMDADLARLFVERHDRLRDDATASIQLPGRRSRQTNGDA